MNDTPVVADQIQEAPAWGIKELVIASIAAAVVVGVTLALAFGTAILLRRAGAPQEIGRPISLAATAVYEIGFIAISYAVARRAGGGWDSLGFRPFPAYYLIGSGILLCSGYLVTAVYGLTLQRFGIGETFPQRTDLLVGNDLFSFIPALIVASVIAPVAEETFFRGLFLTGLRSKLALPLAIVVTSLLFAVIHLVPQVILPIFVLGVFLALLRVWTNSLWPSIALHAAFNGVSLTLVYLFSHLNGRT